MNTVDFDLEAVPDKDWAELRSALRAAGYTTEAVRKLLGLSEPVEEILRNTGRYSYFYLARLAALPDSVSVLARLFLASARVPADQLGRLGGTFERLLRRTGLVAPVDGDPTLVRAAAVITELRGGYFLSDPLFENRGDEFVVHDGADRCMPPHASSLELLDSLRRPEGARSFLDVGCGSGCQSQLFAAGYQRVAGFDPGPRQVQFARANARLNGFPASYIVDRWETFPPDDRFDHVAFNTPSADAAFAFIDDGLDRLLAPSGRAQVWLVCERAEPDRDWASAVARRLRRPDRWRIEPTVHSGSPFALAPERLRERRLPAGSLLVDHPGEAAAFLAGLAARRVTEVASLTLTIHRR
ncbi:methyltransferase domain-containing protein [Micromonospora sp. CPCC 205371]|nr:methyltransferase domain-containing protein [Micromonospora sp. CPCC 205371]